MTDSKLTAKELKAQRRSEKVAAKSAQDPTVEAAKESRVVDKKHSTKKAINQKTESGRSTTGKGTVLNDMYKSDTLSTNIPLTRTIALFSHLEQKKLLTSALVPRDIHPAIVSLALRYSSSQCIGSNHRCKSMLRVFQLVIADYTTPATLQTSLQRHLPAYLSNQISYLVKARPLSISMGAAIRLLKQEISTTSIEASDESNKLRLISFIDTFIRERIDIAGQVIVKAAMARISEGDTILIFAHSTLVQAILIEASRNVNFSVVVVDSRPKYEGRTAIRELTKAGITCTYVMLSAVGYIMPTVTKVFIGAHTVLANGAVYSRAGTAVVSMVASEQHVPVIVACETYKFSDRVQLDSFVTNELGLTAELDLSAHEADLSKPIEESTALPNPARAHQQLTIPLKLNLLYDVTPDKFVTLCISELGSLPTTAIPFAALSEQSGL